MWLSDFEEAIKKVKAILGDCCFMQAQWAWDGSKLIFYMNTFIEPNDGYLVYFRKTHRLEKWYGNTWKNPEHKEVIYEGNE